MYKQMGGLFPFPVQMPMLTRVERFARFRVISREALARGNIAHDPARSRQIPWLRVRLREMMEWREAISSAYN